MTPRALESDILDDHSETFPCMNADFEGTSNMAFLGSKVDKSRALPFWDKKISSFLVVSAGPFWGSNPYK